MKAIILYLLLVLAFQPAQAQVFLVDGNTLAYDTYNTDGVQLIKSSHSYTLRGILEAHPHISLVTLHSAGGSQYEATRMANILIDAKVDTHVDEECSSSCLRLFLAGNKRTASLGAQFGFHRGKWRAQHLREFFEDQKAQHGWQTEFDFAEWLYEFTQKEVYEFITYLDERGVSAEIAAKTYRLGPDEHWYPRRDELLKWGILTE